MKIVELAEAGALLFEYARKSGKELVIVTAGGKPVAALLPIENADMETVSLSVNERFLELIERSRARQMEEGGIPSSEVRRHLGVDKATT